MAISAFSEKSHPPTPEQLRSVLGPAHGPWAELIQQVSQLVPALNELWAFTSKSTGWGLRLRHKERVILYMTPCEGHFLVSFVLGERAVAAAQQTKLPKLLMSAIEAAPRYAEGRGVRLEVSKAPQVPSLAHLASIKLQH